MSRTLRNLAGSASATALVALFLSTSASPLRAENRSADGELAARFAQLALECVHREYPNKIAHVLSSDADARPPRELTPAFYGCYDWHSAVHGHWLLARLARLHPEAPFAAPARAALERSLTPANIAGEVAYFQEEGRRSFERPYGLAWLLQLHAELSEWSDPDAARLAKTLDPLVAEAAEMLSIWIPKLTHPIRIGEHAQTAFAFGLVLDWAREVEDRAMITLLESRSQDLYLGDVGCPLAYEPSGHDFLSPCLAEADLLRRILPATEFASWLDRFLPELGESESGSWLAPAVVTDPGDGKLAHLDGLNLSRAWMLDGIASALAPADPRKPALEAALEAHRSSGLEAVTGEHYEGGHWLGSFATYLVTRRGVVRSASH